jgi:hypothetical protein
VVIFLNQKISIMQLRTFNISTANLFFFLFIPFLLSAQNGEKSFQKEFNWENEDKSKTIFIHVKNGAEMLKMDFEGSISQGDLHLTAYDPEGNRVAGFSLMTSGSEGGNVHVETVEGNGSNSNSNSNSNSGTGSGTSSSSSSNSNSDSRVSVTTSSSESGNSTVTVKSKSKNKNKNGKNYSVTSTTSDSKSAKGIMKKKISDPMPGNWKFVLEVKSVTGYLSAEIDQD